MLTNIQPIHVHPAKIIRWVDGDTVWLEVDQDYRQKGKHNHRLAWIQAPKNSTEEGKAATALVNKLMPPGTEVIVRSYKPEGDPDNWTRWIAEIIYQGVSINQFLLSEGYADPYMGR